MSEKNVIYAIVGPTASGKSRLAMELAKRHGGEIISCDSMQVYKKMDIGTAKPTEAERTEIRHHLIDIVEPDVNFSCQDYAECADEAISDCMSRGKIPIVCGGTGLYLDTLIRGGNSAPSADTSLIRDNLTKRCENGESTEIYEELKRVDPESAEAIHPNNIKRVIRALEIFYSCGLPKSELDRRSKHEKVKYDARVIGLRYLDRNILYRRIEERVDKMLSDGLLREAEALMREGIFEKSRTAAQAIGYKELLGYLSGNCSLEEATEKLKIATRRYAKRQITWFGAKDYVTFTDMDEAGAEKRFEEIVNNAERLFSLC